jgi:hypothetical protein
VNLVTRIRQLPGFTVAAVVFFLVVLMGIGGVAANALWSQSAQSRISVTAGNWGSDPSLIFACNNLVNSNNKEVQFSWNSASQDIIGYELFIQGKTSAPRVSLGTYAPSQKISEVFTVDGAKQTKRLPITQTDGTAGSEGTMFSVILVAKYSWGFLQKDRTITVFNWQSQQMKCG